MTHHLKSQWLVGCSLPRELWQKRDLHACPGTWPAGGPYQPPGGGQGSWQAKPSWGTSPHVQQLGCYLQGARLEEWPNRNLMTFNKGTHKSCWREEGRKNPLHPNRLGSSSAGWALRLGPAASSAFPGFPVQPLTKWAEFCKGPSRRLRAGALTWGAEEPGLAQPWEKAITGGLKSHSTASLPDVGVTEHRERGSDWTGEIFFPMRPGSQWSRLPKEAVPALSLKVFKT